MPRCLTITMLLTSVVVTSGCASKAKTSGAGAEGGLSAAGAAARSRLANTENGLELRRWTITDYPQRLRMALVKYAGESPIDEDAQARLQRNGFRFLRIPAGQVDALLDDLGGATINTTEWHGQAHEWRALAERLVEAPASSSSPAGSTSGRGAPPSAAWSMYAGGGRAVAIDGKVRRYDRGMFRLMMRGWTVQMEEGPRIHLELLPQHYRPPANNLRLLMGEKEQPIEGFASTSLDLQLEAGWAYVLVGDSPEAEWPGAAGASSATQAPAHPRLDPRSRLGPSETIGPEAATPLTIGELLLSMSSSVVGTNPTASAAGRQVLVFVPKISPELFPPGQGLEGVSAEAQQHTRR